MNVLSSPYSPYAPAGPRAPEAAPRPPVAAAPAALSEAEQSQIAASFPEKPAVVQRLYGPGREVQTPTALGARLDLSA